MMNRIPLTMIMALLMVTLHAQTAEALLDDMIGRLSSGEMISGSMTVSIYLGGDLQQSDKGQIAMRGYDVYFDLPTYRIVANQSLCWLVDKDGEQVEIAHLEDQYLFKHPRAILDSLRAGAYRFDFEEPRPDHRPGLDYLAFSPVDVGDEVSKVRLAILEESLLPYELTVITKDGYRYQLKFDDLTMTASKDISIFKMDRTLYEGYEFYDLRLD